MNKNSLKLECWRRSSARRLEQDEMRKVGLLSRAVAVEKFSIKYITSQRERHFGIHHAYLASTV